MKNQKLNIFSLTVLLTLGVFASFAKADITSPNAYQLFGISAAYNDVFFGDYYGRNGDIEGHAAIKGNLDAQSYGFGSGEQNLHPNSQSPTLVVGGNAKVSGSGVYDGDAYIAGTLTPQNGQTKWNMLTTQGTGPYNTVDPGYQGKAGTVYVAGTPDSELAATYQKHTEASIPFDFTVAETQLRDVSSNLWGLDNTVAGGVVNGMYTVDLTGLTGLQVVTIDASIFNGLQYYQNIYINAGADTTLIINVTDEYGMNTLSLNKQFIINGVGNPFYGDFDGSNILINTGVSQVNVANNALNASLMALDALVNVTLGNIDGQVFAAGAHTENGGEFHAYYTFDDKHFSDGWGGGGGGNVTPEPATCLIFSCGLFGLGYVARRRRLLSK